MDEFRTLNHLKLLPDKANFQTMIAVFGEPISQINTLFSEDTKTWTVCPLQGWVNGYENVRFIALNNYTAVITGEYNMEYEKAVGEKHTRKEP